MPTPLFAWACSSGHGQIMPTERRRGHATRLAEQHAKQVLRRGLGTKQEPRHFSALRSTPAPAVWVAYYTASQDHLIRGGSDEADRVLAGRIVASFGRGDSDGGPRAARRGSAPGLRRGGHGRPQQRPPRVQRAELPRGRRAVPRISQDLRRESRGFRRPLWPGRHPDRRPGQGLYRGRGAVGPGLRARRFAGPAVRVLLPGRGAPRFGQGGPRPGGGQAGRGRRLPRQGHAVF
jgi:hypothetical protein